MSFSYSSSGKRVLDLFAASFGLALLAPLLLLLVAIVACHSPGGAFYWGRRGGRNGKAFLQWKFRSMFVGADLKGPAFTSSSDRRVTVIGRWLRVTKLDELPQLINVVRGEMSLVGPRPEAEKYLSYFGSYYDEVMSVRPGITGVSQVLFRREQELLAALGGTERAYLQDVLPRKLACDGHYVRHCSLCFDVVILWRTVRAVLFG